MGKAIWGLKAWYNYDILDVRARYTTKNLENYELPREGMMTVERLTPHLPMPRQWRQTKRDRALSPTETEPAPLADCVWMTTGDPNTHRPRKR